ncbi:proline rich mitotic checkpoint control factor [Phyllostomus discolor]|uniref:Proline rich mitotic checkpoint control factor n=1 Tax=Phyllostomus discolor TaxID=89673 RepID=A0A833YJS9_9CHIR|nr:proline rich mitotic checkpoint control factor [Phyllostomus discolor]
MSLVAYASSEESEPDEAEPEEEEAVAPTSGPTLGGLFASLPAPKGPALLPPPPQMLAPSFPPPLLLPPPSGDPRLQPPPPLPFGLGGFPPPPGVSPAEAAGVGEGLGLGLPSALGPGLSLPPSIGGAGPPLGLPKPKKRTEPVKIAAPELHKGDSDSEEDEPTKKKTVLQAEPPGVEPYPYPIPTVPEELPPGTEPEPAFQDDAANAPLEFKMAAGSSGAPWMPKPGDDYSYSQFSTYGDANAAGAYYQDYYSGGYYPAQDPALVPSQEIASDASFIDDEAFKRLQGKRNRGREEINFVEIKGDDQLSGAQQWMTKSLTEEKTMKSFSKKKGEQPTGQQRRKHQITYLIHQAKERELELKNTWSENKLSRRQTQAKYGF